MLISVISILGPSLANSDARSEVPVALNFLNAVFNFVGTLRETDASCQSPGVWKFGIPALTLRGHAFIHDTSWRRNAPNNRMVCAARPRTYLKAYDRRSLWLLPGLYMNRAFGVKILPVGK
ncbi:predicted protein [Sclerotinia sclerotiorum 1980 UF-70]|uniref:Uncharacterized protein n=1 Tax=Sclerotinia sclerotiorum (strain ATCC 18683 / 1980 / Ss-1) TaxID=665079 RepID=A7F7M0_SCLS1|nr:predicted protein [Sclerotinia sclerotiorum 1980 UF-70]EDN98741.1 predicted protein [Sclerotinia sclerotiorum 1980 UF-70]